MMMVKPLLVLLALTLLGCAYPSTRLNAVDDRPLLGVANAPKGAIIRVDGIAMGNATDFDGTKKSLALEKGTHKIEISTENAVLYSEKVFLGGGTTKIIKLSGGATK